MAAAYDVVLRDVLIVDGSGVPGREGDVAVADGRIAAVGRVEGKAAREIAGRGLVAAPGFIDAHTHDDRLALIDPGMAPKASQGITTVVSGNCGISLAPMPEPREAEPPLTLLGGRDDSRFRTFADYLAALRARPAALNVLPLVGHTTLRVAAMAETGRPADAAEIAQMRELLAEGLRAGAAGLSTGLYYPPAESALAAEVESLLEVVAAFGGLYTAHVRDEGDGLFGSLAEALASAKAAGVPLVVSHLKCVSPAVWHRSGDALAMLEAAARDQPVAFDVYPYAASSTMLRCDAVEHSERVTVTWSDADPGQAGQDLGDIAVAWCCTPVQAAARLLPGGAIYHRMKEADVARILSHPLAMIGSDGLPHDRHPHPRLWGSFPRVLGRYARAEGLFPLEEAVRKMTALPASIFGLKDRGVLRPGAVADLVVFDRDHVADLATYADPVRPSAGIELVMVNGTVVRETGADTGARAGRLLSRASEP